MKIVINFMAVSVIVVLIALYLTPSGGCKESAYHATVRNDMKQICLAVNYIHEKTGKFPNTLTDIPEGVVEKETLWFYDPESGRPYDWIYRGKELNRIGYDHDSVLLVSPTIFVSGSELPEKGKEKYRFVGHVAGYVEKITEPEYEALMVEQGGGINSEAAPRSETP